MGAGCSIDCSENIHDFESQSNELKSIDIKDMDKQINSKPYQQSLMKLIQPNDYFDDFEQLEQDLLTQRMQSESGQSAFKDPSKQDSHQMEKYYFDLEDEFSDLSGHKAFPSPQKQIINEDQRSQLISPLQLTQFNQSILLFNQKKYQEYSEVGCKHSDTKLKSILKQRKSTNTIQGLTQQLSDIKEKIEEGSYTSSKKRVRFQTRHL